MKPDGNYQFRRAGSADLNLLLEWQSRPHVLEWWGTEPPFGADGADDPRVARWIVSIDRKPFAYMQDYTVHGWEGHYFAHLPTGSRGIDQYIADPDMTGKGHGPGFMRERLKVLFEEGAPVVATDPHPDNSRAISAYRKTGFSIFGAAQETKWGLILPMKMDRPGKSA